MGIDSVIVPLCNLLHLVSCLVDLAEGILITNTHLDIRSLILRHGSDTEMVLALGG